MFCSANWVSIKFSTYNQGFAITFMHSLLSKDLQAEFIGVKGFSERNLHRMKLIYEEMQGNSISPQVVAKLHWGHISFQKNSPSIPTSPAVMHPIIILICSRGDFVHPFFVGQIPFNCFSEAFFECNAGFPLQVVFDFG